MNTNGNHEKIRHNLLEIIFMVIVATICRAETWQEIAAFAEEKEIWFRKYLELKNGIPSHDMFERCFRMIDPGQFQKCFFMDGITPDKKERGNYCY